MRSMRYKNALLRESPKEYFRAQGEVARARANEWTRQRVEAEDRNPMVIVWLYRLMPIAAFWGLIYMWWRMI